MDVLPYYMVNKDEYFLTSRK